jgi:hypothetical protein
MVSFPALTYPQPTPLGARASSQLHVASEFSAKQRVAPSRSLSTREKSSMVRARVVEVCTASSVSLNESVTNTKTAGLAYSRTVPRLINGVIMLFPPVSQSDNVELS